MNICVNTVTRISFARVPSFEVSMYKVTNRQMLEFVNDGGYEKKEFWSEEGWQWRTFRDVKYVARLCIYTFKV